MEDTGLWWKVGILAEDIDECCLKIQLYTRYRGIQLQGEVESGIAFPGT